MTKTGIEERLATYEQIESYRERPLIVYTTSTRQGVAATMASDAVREFVDQIDAIEDGDAVDVLIHSTGGDALTAWKLMSLLRERFRKVAVIVPFAAFSAATIFALGADEIIMHPHASLGPIDPQIRVTLRDGSSRGFAYEDVGAFLRFLLEDVRISEQAYVSPTLHHLFDTVDPLVVGASKRASDLSSTVGERLLSLHMTGAEDKIRAKKIAEDLNKSFSAHGDAVSRSRAKELQLKVADRDSSLEALIWAAYLKIESYMEFRKRFNPLEHVVTNIKDPQALKQLAPLQLPSDAPKEAVSQLWNAIFQQAAQGRTLEEVEYRLVHALIESRRIASEFVSEGTFTAFRNVDGAVNISQTEVMSGWRSVPLEKP